MANLNIILIFGFMFWFIFIICLACYTSMLWTKDSIAVWPNLPVMQDHFSCNKAGTTVFPTHFSTSVCLISSLINGYLSIFKWWLYLCLFCGCIYSSANLCIVALWYSWWWKLVAHCLVYLVHIMLSGYIVYGGGRSLYIKDIIW